MNLTATVLPVFGFNLTSDVVEAIGTAEETLTFQLTLDNIGNAGDTYDLALSGLPADWNQTLPSSVSIDPYASQGATLEVLVETDRPVGGSYLLDLIATSNKTSVSKSLVLNITVEVEKGVELLCTVASPLVAYKGTTQAQLTLKNLGNVQDSFALTFEDDPSWTVALDADDVDIAPYAEAKLFANITAKADAAPGLHTLTVEADSLLHAGLKDSADLSLTLQQVYGLELEAKFSAAMADNSYTINATITNTGNGRDTFTLALEIPDGWTSDFDDETTLNAGERTTFTVIVIAAKDATAKVYPIKVTAASKGDPKETMAMTLNVTVQAQGPPPLDDDDTGGPSVLMWVLIPVLAVILIVIAVAVVIFLLMRRKKAAQPFPPAQAQQPAPAQQATGGQQQPAQGAQMQHAPAKAPPSQQAPGTGTAGRAPGAIPAYQQASPQQPPGSAPNGQQVPQSGFAGQPPAQIPPAAQEIPQMQPPDTTQPDEGSMMGAPDMMAAQDTPDMAAPDQLKQ